MSHSNASPPLSKRDRSIWWVSIGAASLSAILGFTAFSLGKEGLDILDALYSTAHLVGGHMGREEIEKAEGDDLILGLFYAARFLAVVAVALAAIALVIDHLGRGLRLWLRVFWGKHYVICGLGPVGVTLAERLIAGGRKVVIVDPAPDHTTFADLEGKPPCFIVGDPGKHDARKKNDRETWRLLRRAGVHRAKFVFATSDNDAANISAGLRAADFSRSCPSTRRPPLDIHVHISDPALRVALRNSRHISDSDDRVHINSFNVCDSGARLLLLANPLDYVRISPTDRRHVQLILLGFGTLGEAILVRAALAAHYPNLKRLHAVVICPGATGAKNAFLGRYPNFDKVARAEFIEGDPDDPGTLALIARHCSEMETITTVVVTTHEPTRSLAQALSLAALLPDSVRIRFRHEADPSFSAILAKHLQSESPRCPVTSFSTVRAACDSANWSNDNLDFMVKRIHADYLSKLPEEKRNPQTNPSAVEWDSLPEDLRESNRQAADHIPVKLRAVGCHEAYPDAQDPGQLVNAFSDEEVEMLAKMEHRRWMAERFLSGWNYGRTKDVDKRLSPCLVEWEDLPTAPDDFPQYDRNSVRLIPHMLANIGIELRR